MILFSIWNSDLILVIIFMAILVTIVVIMATKERKDRFYLSTEESDDDMRQQSIVFNIFSPKGVSKSHRMRERDKLFAIKLKIFCALHKPIHLAKLYHFIVLAIIFFSITALNIIDEELAKKGHRFNTKMTIFKVFTDSVLIGESVLSIPHKLLLKLFNCLQIRSHFKHWTDFETLVVWCRQWIPRYERNVQIS